MRAQSYPWFQRPGAGTTILPALLAVALWVAALVVANHRTHGGVERTFWSAVITTNAVATAGIARIKNLVSGGGVAIAAKTPLAAKARRP